MALAFYKGSHTQRDKGRTLRPVRSWYWYINKRAGWLLLRMVVRAAADCYTFDSDLYFTALRQRRSWLGEHDARVGWTATVARGGIAQFEHVVRANSVGFKVWI